MTEKQAANIIRCASIAFFFTALVFASGAFAPIDGLSVWMHDLLDWPLDGATAPYTEEARWFSAIGGGVFAGLAQQQGEVVEHFSEGGAELQLSGDRQCFGVVHFGLTVAARQVVQPRHLEQALDHLFVLVAVQPTARATRRIESFV